MFDHNQYLDGEYDHEYVSVPVRNQSFRLRRLDGLELIQLQDINKTEEKFCHILGCCVWDQEKDRQLGTEKAKNLLRTELPLSLELIHKILDLSEEMLEAEDLELEIAKKNFNQTVMLS